MPFELRSARLADAEAIANVFSPSLRLLTFLPMLHTVEEDRWFIENKVLKEFDVTVAEDKIGIVSFLARKGQEVRLLYTHPDYIGRPLGDPFDVASLHEFRRILQNLGKELLHIVDSEFTMLRTRGG